MAPDPLPRGLLQDFYGNAVHPGKRIPREVDRVAGRDHGRFGPKTGSTRDDDLRTEPRWLQPVSPGEELLLIAADAALADPNFRASVRQMHAEGYPLVQMVGALGLDDDMSDRIRQILEGLPDDAIAGIRTATLAMLDSDDYQMPVVCTVPASDLGKPVSVEVSPEKGVPTIHVRAAKG
jgi:hypothetical protein